MSAPKMVNFSKSTPEFNRKFYNLYTQRSMVDVTLSAEGQFLDAHKIILAVASPWFEDLFELLPKDKQPVIVLKDVSLTLLHHIIEFIYLGTTDIPEDDVITFKTSLDALRISLEDDEGMDHDLEDTRESNQLENSHEDEEEQFEAVKQPEVKKETPIAEPNWEDVVIKDEPQEHSITEVKEKTIVGSLKSPIKLPSSIQLRPSMTPKIQSFGTLVNKNSPNTSPVIRIRTPASINDDQNVKTLKLVQRLPSNSALHPIQKSPQDPNRNIQELSKRLSKAILIRRVKKSDGSFVSERAPIKIIQGMKIQKISSSNQITQVKTIRPIMQAEKKSMPIFRCSHCAKAFSVNKRRNAHEKFCFKNPTRPSSQCPFCPMVLCNPMYIGIHVKKIHGVDENGKPVAEEAIE